MLKKLGFIKCFGFLFGLIFALAFGVCFFDAHVVYATTSSPDITRANIKEYDFDESLFNAVLSMARQLNCNQSLVGRGFDFDLFLKNTDPEYSPTYVTTKQGTPGYDENVAARNEIVSDLRLGVLNLTTGENAKYDCLKDVEPIKDITGLNVLSLNFVTKLYLNDNEIEEINNQDLKNISNLQELYVSNNKLKTCEFSSNLVNLGVLDLSKNSLSKINLSSLILNSSVDLSNNNIESVASITFAQNKKINNLDLDFNLLKGLTSQDFEMLNLKVQNSLNLGVQGLKQSQDSLAGDLIEIYNIEGNLLPNISVEISYFEGDDESTKSNFYIEDEDNVICETLGVQDKESLYLPAGKIRINFYSNNVLIDSDVYKNYASRVLNVKVPNLSYYININGKKTTETYQENDFNLVFYLEEGNIPNIDDVEEYSKIYSYFDKNSKQEVNSLKITNNGEFTCSAYIVFDDISSNVFTVKVTRRNVTGIIIGIVIIITLIVLVASGYFIVRWYRAGAMVAPLSDKELASVNRRRAKKQDKYKDVVVRGAGKERLFVRKENDEEVLQNLNEKEDFNAHYNANEKGDYNKDDYTGNYVGVGHNFERYNTEEFKNDFDEEPQEDDKFENEFVEDGEVDNSDNDDVIL